MRVSTARIRSVEDYKGEVMNGRAHGEGEWQGTNGSIFKGTFKTMPHGFCIETTKSGTRIEGERSDGALHGNLTYYKVNGPITNEVWKNNERVMSSIIESSEEAWFGDGIKVKKPKKTAESLVIGWLHDGYNPKQLR